jgi:tRNA nucleotidyltransferase (CCA-adding enzyme)
MNNQVNIYDTEVIDYEDQDFNIFFNNVPKNVRMVSAMLQHAGYEAYLVGGCVRDHLIGVIPKDYDITTNAKPEEIIKLFPRTFYENSFGTVGVVTVSEEEAKKMATEAVKIYSSGTENDNIIKEMQDMGPDERIKQKVENITRESIIEVTPYRKEGKYSDGRHPDEVKWAFKIEEDLSRRDFTCNAIAYDIAKGKLVDLYGGIKDIKERTLRTVGNPKDRFTEDALRMLRAVRFSAQLGFKIENATYESIVLNENLIKNISHERIRDEFIKILMSKTPKATLELASRLKILKYISHEIENGIGIRQNQAHSFDVWEHNLRTCQHAADKNWSLELRLSALFHDVSKPETRRFSKDKNDYTFYGHDVVGGRVSREILTRLKFPNEIVEYVTNMVRWHMFFSDTEQITISAVRRLITNVGRDKIWDLVNLRICDRVGTGRPKEEPYRFRKYQSMIEQALTDPISLKQLKIDGTSIINVTQETPGPRIGFILNALFAEVLEDPSKNSTEYLNGKALHMKTLDTEVLKRLADEGKEVLKSKNDEQLEEIKKEFRVK